MITQFNFYRKHADYFANLNNAEAGRFIKLTLKYMFRDEEPDSLSTDKTTSLFMLLYGDLIGEKIREEQNIHTPTSGGKHFAFRSVYANIFLCLKDVEAGILIKEVCDYIFGTSLSNSEETATVKTYFSALKGQLSKSKVQSANAAKRRKEVITLEKIRSDFPLIQGNLRADNEILNRVDLAELYNFIKANTEENNKLSMYEVVKSFKKNRRNL